VNQLEQLLNKLRNPSLYDHPTVGFSIIETHISYVLLTGQYVYKFKKPLDLDFLNFSKLEDRLYYCQEEVRLNQKMAANIYLGVVKITGDLENPEINGDGPVIEYAVKMREFPQQFIFDHLLINQQISPHLIRETAHIIAEFHQNIAIGLADNPYGTYTQVQEPVIQNFQQIGDFLNDDSDIKELSLISDWAEAEHKKLKDIITHRKLNGFVRECHGDIHLGNIALMNEKPVIFDCIEFNDSFRWTDTIADIGFLVMDLEDKQKPELANQLINHYLHESQDYQGLYMLRYYKSYRAVIRAKIALFQKNQEIKISEQLKCWQQYKNCMQLAAHYCQVTQPLLLITHGLTATGKSSIAEYLVKKTGVIHINSDITRKKLTGQSLTSQNQTPTYQGIYSHEMTETVYNQLRETAQVILESGFSVIVDATFIKKKHRQRFKQLAVTHQVNFKIIHTIMDENKILEWLARRQQQTYQISEAREDIYQALKQNLEPLTDEEKADAIILDTLDKHIVEKKLHPLVHQLRSY